MRSVSPACADDEPAAVQHVAEIRPSRKRSTSARNLIGSRLQLGQRLGQSVGDLHVPAAQRTQQLRLVIAGHA